MGDAIARQRSSNEETTYRRPAAGAKPRMRDVRVERRVGRHALDVKMRSQLEAAAAIGWCGWKLAPLNAKRHGFADH